MDSIAKMIPEVANEMERTANLEELGFRADEYGQLKAEGCLVMSYSSFGEWEIDIRLPNGKAFGFDVPHDVIRKALATPQD